jgi:hypothetical protein
MLRHPRDPMTIRDREAIHRKLDTLGTAEVKRRLETGAYAQREVPIVKAWLAEQQAVTNAPNAAKSTTLVDRYMERLKNQPAIAVVVITAMILAWAAQFTDSLSKITNIFSGVFHPAVPLAPIPGDSGWVLLGDLDPKGAKYVRGPFYEVEKSNYPDHALTPRKGELVRLTAERNVIIANYKIAGLAGQFTAPWTLNSLSEADYTGVKIPKGGIVEVRDVSLGSYPDQPIVVWVRVAAPPN